MKLNRLSMLTLLFLAASCIMDREAPNGMKIRVHKDGTGSYPKPGEFIIASMIVKDGKDSVWRDTHEQNMPMIIPIGDESAIPNEKGVNSCFRVMKIGDSVSVDIEVKLLFGDQPIPPQLKPGDKMTYTFAVKDITDQTGVNAIQQDLEQRQRAEMKKQQDGQLATDTLTLDAYLAERNITAIRDKSGLRYVITRMGNGPKPTVNSQIKVNYKGSLMDGKVFDQSKGPVEWPLSQMITGWQIGFTFLPKGTAATLYIPSTLGYGQNGYYPDIPPNANLIFEVELLDVRN